MTDVCISKAPPRLDEVVKGLTTDPQPNSHIGVVRSSVNTVGMGALALHILEDAF